MKTTNISTKEYSMLIVKNKAMKNSLEKMKEKIKTLENTLHTYEEFIDSDCFECNRIEEKIKKIKDKIRYALEQENLSYGMDENETRRFRERKVFSILREILGDE